MHRSVHKYWTFGFKFYIANKGGNDAWRNKKKLIINNLKTWFLNTILFILVT